MKQYQIVKQHGRIFVEQRSKTYSGWTAWSRVTTTRYNPYSYDYDRFTATWLFVWTAKRWINKTIKAEAKKDRQSVPKVVWGPYP